ncbi:MAG TPA: four helix bundle protein [Terriglobia bacterium]|nr:four helix bundle protein [Terriglobia bacterium]
MTVWQRSVTLATQLYRATGRFPSDEKFGLISQIRRSAASIPANIAEGWGRGSTREYIQFLLMARGSLMELETHLIISHNLGYLGPEPLSALSSETRELGRMLNGLINALRARGSASR